MYVAPGIFAAVSQPGYLTLYATGIRCVADLSAVTATLGDVTAQVLYAGPQNQFPGLDQISLQIPATLSGTFTLRIVANGVAANPVSITLP
jgi:uncharacterized protein (TIGR03437 family)